MGCNASKSEANDMVWEMVMQHQMTALSPDSLYTLDSFAQSSPKAGFNDAQIQSKLRLEAVARARARGICSVCHQIGEDVRSQPDSVQCLAYDVQLLSPHAGRAAAYQPAEGSPTARITALPDDLAHIRQLLEYLGFRAKLKGRSTLLVSWA